jgi:hypothetical protein
MAEYLARDSACFEFQVQLQTDPEAMPIEDPTIEWSERDSPFVTVAYLEIAPQSFASPDQQAFCEHLSYTPWHSIEEHRPLGGINRARKAVYQSMQQQRHDHNGVPDEEPTR